MMCSVLVFCNAKLEFVCVVLSLTKGKLIRSYFSYYYHNA